MRARIALWFAVIALAAGCSETEPDTCTRAADLVEDCTRMRPEAPTDCSAIVDAVEDQGCEGLSGERNDGCSFLDFLFGGCDEPLAPLGPEPEGSPTRFPIILAHGFNTSTTNFWAFNGVDTELRKDGHQVVLGSVPPFDVARTRSEFLKAQVDQLIDAGHEKVNLICFSQGGLDCRYLASKAGWNYASKIASITTISSPNHGTGMADAAIKVLPDPDSAAADLVDAVATLWGRTFSEVADDSRLVASLTEMSEANMQSDFNVRHPEGESGEENGVFYQSWAGFSHVGGITLPGIEASIDSACRDQSGKLLMMRHEGTQDKMDPLLVPSAPFVGHFDALHPGDALPNDGVSTVESAKWGVFRGCFPADHLDQVGQVDDDPIDPDTGFAYLRFYRNIAFGLAEMGF